VQVQLIEELLDIAGIVSGKLRIELRAVIKAAIALECNTTLLN